MAKQKLEGENAGIGQLYQHFGFVQEYLCCFFVAHVEVILQYHGLGEASMMVRFYLASQFFATATNLIKPGYLS